MSDRRIDPDHGSRPRAWVLGAPGAGDNRQLQTLVELVGAEARWISRFDPLWRVLLDRVIGPRGGRMPADKRDLFAPPWPDLVLIIGGRSVIDARRIRQASGGRSRIVCLGRPWAPPGWFDLVITTPQYRLPPAPNVEVIDLPLNRPAGPDDRQRGQWSSGFADLPRPVLGVLLGGNSGSYRFTPIDAGLLARCINALVDAAGGSALVVGSPRTPAAAIERIRECLSVPARVYPWRADGPNAYPAVVDQADAFLVTGDSASMIAETCRTGKPVSVFELTERAHHRINRRWRSVTPWLRRPLRALARRGLWFPARDMRLLHQRLRESGRIIEPEALLTATSESTRPPADPTDERIAARIGALIGQ